MKVRDLGKAILDFELNLIPKAIFFIFSLLLEFLFSIFCWAVRTIKALWGLILIGCVILFFTGLQKDCVNYCSGLIELHYHGLAIENGSLFTIILLLVVLVAAFMIDKKLPKTNTKTSQ